MDEQDEGAQEPLNKAADFLEPAMPPAPAARASVDVATFPLDALVAILKTTEKTKSFTGNWGAPCCSLQPAQGQGLDQPARCAHRRIIG